jgi:hypothetical protein
MVYANEKIKNHNFPLETFREQKESGTFPNYFKRA